GHQGRRTPARVRRLRHAPDPPRARRVDRVLARPEAVTPPDPPATRHPPEAPRLSARSRTPQNSPCRLHQRPAALPKHGHRHTRNVEPDAPEVTQATGPINAPRAAESTGTASRKGDEARTPHSAWVGASSRELRRESAPPRGGQGHGRPCPASHATAARPRQPGRTQRTDQHPGRDPERHIPCGITASIPSRVPTGPPSHADAIAHTTS